MIYRVVLLIALLLPLRAANAEPGPVGQWLMSTPASLWTLGMTKLQIMVDAWRGPHPLANFSRFVHHDWQQNRIIIVILTRETFEEDSCKFYLNEVRLNGGVLNGKLLDPLNSSAYSSAFERGFLLGNEPDDYLKKLDDIIKITISMEGGRCEGQLISTEALISR